MKRNYWWITTFTAVLISGVAFSRTPTPLSIPSEAKATATYGNPLIYTDGEILFKPAEANWLDTNGNSGSYDMVLPSQYCPSASEVICVLWGGGEDFAIPRRALNIGDSWTFNAMKFVVLPSFLTYAPGNHKADAKPLSEISVLGQKVRFYVVARMGRTGHIPVRLYMFSPNRGLIGVAAPAEGGWIRPNWLQEAYGPGSKQFDSQIAPSAFITKGDVEKLMKAKIPDQQ